VNDGEKAKYFLVGVVGALGRQVDWRSYPSLGLLVDIAHVHDLLLERRRRPVEQEQVVPFLSGDLGLRAGGDPHVVDVVHDNISVVLLPPFLDVPLVEPLVVGRDEVDPLKDLERLLSRMGPSRNDEISAEPSRQRSGPHGFDEFTATSGVFCHVPPPLEFQTRLRRCASPDACL
jgi:hypothetical protein